MCYKVLFFQIPPSLASKLNIRPHSAVRIKPVKSAVKVATKIRLQPLKPQVTTVVHICFNEPLHLLKIVLVLYTVFLYLMSI